MGKNKSLENMGNIIKSLKKGKITEAEAILKFNIGMLEVLSGYKLDFKKSNGAIEYSNFLIKPKVVLSEIMEINSEFTSLLGDDEFSFGMNITMPKKMNRKVIKEIMEEVVTGPLDNEDICILYDVFQTKYKKDVRNILIAGGVILLTGVIAGVCYGVHRSNKNKTINSDNIAQISDDMSDVDIVIMDDDIVVLEDDDPIVNYNLQAFA